MQVFLYLFMFFSLVYPYVLHAETTSSSSVIYTIDFSKQEPGGALSWLKKNGFSLLLDAHRLNPRFENHAIVLSTDGQVAGMIGKQFKPDEYLYQVKRVRIEWGVYQYPIGADWENDI